MLVFFTILTINIHVHKYNIPIRQEPIFSLQKSSFLASLLQADGQHLLTGGHNLWDVAYLRAAPITDTSIVVDGDIAQGAHIYLDYL